MGWEGGTAHKNTHHNTPNTHQNTPYHTPLNPPTHSHHHTPHGDTPRLHHRQRRPTGARTATACGAHRERRPCRARAGDSRNARRWRPPDRGGTNDWPAKKGRERNKKTTRTGFLFVRSGQVRSGQVRSGHPRPIATPPESKATRFQQTCGELLSTWTRAVTEESGSSPASTVENPSETSTMVA